MPTVAEPSGVGQPSRTCAALPTYRVGDWRLYVGAWKHGVSLYGWETNRDAGFAARLPELITGKGTLRLRPEDAAGIPDDELLDLVRAALAS